MEIKEFVAVNKSEFLNFLAFKIHCQRIKKKIVRKMSLEELTIPQLTEMCQRERISVTHRHKSDLVDRLHNHYDGMCTATPEKDFFMYMRETWKKAQAADDKSKKEHFQECMENWHNDVPSLMELSDSQLKAHFEMSQIVKSSNPGDELIKYYARGKEAWLEKDSSAEEDLPQSGGESNYSDNKEDEEDEDDDEAKEGEEDEDADEEEDEDADEEEDEDSDEEEEEEEEEEEVEVDLDVSPADTWLSASKIRKAEWIKSRKWVAYMQFVLKDIPQKNWTMKRFLHELCILKNIRGYRKQLTAKKCGQLLDTGRLQPSAVTVGTADKKVPPPPN